MAQLQSYGLFTLVSWEDWHTQSMESGKGLLWREFLSDPSIWWDNRNRKRSPRQPDFLHQATKVPLWMDDPNNPSWVKHELIRHGFAVEKSYNGAANAADAGFLPSLLACGKTKDLARGIRIHNEIMIMGLPEKEYSDALVNMYVKCGELERAQALLDMHRSKSVVSWTALVAGYVRKGQGQRALNCFEQMQHKGILPDAVTYVCVFRACGVVGALDKGRKLHQEIAKRGLMEQHIVLGNAVIYMYTRCGALSLARSVLEKLPSRDVVSWNTLIRGFSQKEQAQQALECFEQMQHQGIRANSVTYMCVLKACAAIGAVDKGKQVCDEISRQGLLKHNVVLAGALVDMYAKCGDLAQAKSILEKLPSRNVIMWNALIGGFAQQEQGHQALECLEQMEGEGICADAVTYLGILRACALIRAVDKGKEIHDEILRQGFLEHNVALGGALVDMYAKCGALPQAQGALEKLPSRDVVSWSALIAGYAESGLGQRAFECLEQMKDEGILPNAVTYTCSLRACGVNRAIDKGKQIHDEILSQGMLEDNRVLGNALVDMYAKCGAVLQARSVLKELPSRDVFSWNALLGGYTQCGQGQQALGCLEQMRREGINPDAVTYVYILKACALLRNVDKGKEIHDEIARLGWLEHSVMLGGALVEMYAKCGALPHADSVVEKLPFCDNVSWNALIGGYAQKCQYAQAFKCFEKMQLDGVHPTAVTFICLLNLCSHLGMVDKGQELFDDMGAKYGLKPDMECFTCMVDLLGRAGHLVKAAKLIQEMPLSATSAIWHCLLGACRKWVDVKVGSWAFERAVELDMGNGAAYVLMVNIYAAAGLPEKAREIEAMRIRNKAWKLPGCCLD